MDCCNTCSNNIDCKFKEAVVEFMSYICYSDYFGECPLYVAGDNDLAACTIDIKRKYPNIEKDVMDVYKLKFEYEAECKRIADRCSRDGYPEHGSNYELRCESAKKYYNEVRNTILRRYNNFGIDVLFSNLDYQYKGVNPSKILVNEGGVYSTYKPNTLDAIVNSLVQYVVEIGFVGITNARVVVSCSLFEDCWEVQHQIYFDDIDNNEILFNDIVDFFNRVSYSELFEISYSDEEYGILSRFTLDGLESPGKRRIESNMGINSMLSNINTSGIRIDNIGYESFDVILDMFESGEELCSEFNFEISRA